MGKFGDMQGAGSGQGGVYFEPGQYEVEIVKCKMDKNRKDEDCIIIEGKILRSDCESRPAGMEASQVIMLRHDAWKRNFNNFMTAANDCELEEIEEGAYEYATGPDNPLAGVKLHLLTFLKPTKAGGVFTVHRWSESQLPATE